MATFGLSEGLWGHHSRGRHRPKVAPEDLSEATGATQEEGRRRMGRKYGDHRPEPSREDPLSKMPLPHRRGWYFCKIDERKKRPQSSIYSRNGAAEGAPGGSLGGPWVPLGGPFGGLWGSLKRPPGAPRDHLTPISANRRPSKIIVFIV